MAEAPLGLDEADKAGKVECGDKLLGESISGILLALQAASATPKQLGAVAAALARACLHPRGEEEGCASEIHLRASVIKKDIGMQVRSATRGQQDRRSGAQRATRNVATHSALGCGSQKLAHLLQDPKQSQRGGKQARQKKQEEAQPTGEFENLQRLADYEGKNFVSIQKADVKLDKSEEEIKDMFSPLTTDFTKKDALKNSIAEMDKAKADVKLDESEEKKKIFSKGKDKKRKKRLAQNVGNGSADDGNFDVLAVGNGKVGSGVSTCADEYSENFVRDFVAKVGYDWCRANDKEKELKVTLRALGFGDDEYEKLSSDAVDCSAMIGYEEFKKILAFKIRNRDPRKAFRLFDDLDETGKGPFKHLKRAIKEIGELKSDARLQEIGDRFTGVTTR